MRTQLTRVTYDSCDKRRAQRGSIVNIASVCGLSSFTSIMPYIASKHAVVGITRAAAIDHAKNGIRVNAVCPGLVHTPMLMERREKQAKLPTDNVVHTDPEITPMGRLAYPEEIADVCVFLSSSLSSYTQVAMIVVDGGRMAAY
jgi:NAD(P)-dependent dehydrogenase (short-subunit alcohol dehydrogenase family)